MSVEVKKLFDNIWQNYLQVTPSAEKIHQLLGSGSDVINDHVAYRTFNHEKVNIEKLAQHLLALGYKEGGEYHFEAKKLYAKHFEHEDDTLPKVFISELLVEEFSPQAQAIINKVVDHIDASLVATPELLYSGRNWPLSYEEYQTLLAESEYAAWLSAWGYRANHFTVSINYLENFDDIEQVNQCLKDAGYALNASGGEIKGNAEVKLEQSSTMADKAKVEFSDQTVDIPSCFYEFAKRYPLENGKLYTGFVAASADKIFESTNSKI
ncbi:DUF1338 domain-containing protein [Thalassotalea hakodatensis]|uniref:DUF1338 domain-containing protein n=1 Tax=Thalassotalea hakodatensis TaxID=3030492 RepID=UPI002573CACF|nr:DUF1338 domain-containing protein [Thalassotalea hakodatensis]